MFIVCVCERVSKESDFVGLALLSPYMALGIESGLQVWGAGTFTSWAKASLTQGW